MHDGECVRVFGLTQLNVKCCTYMCPYFSYNHLLKPVFANSRDKYNLTKFKNS